ncbi:MAG: S8 family serine peptidase [Thermoleophilia bacterium]
MTTPRTRSRRATAALIGGALATAALAAGGASAADTRQIVIMDPDANLSAQVRAEERRGNDVGAVIRTIGKGFVADLDAADVRRLKADPDVVHIEPDRPMRLVAGPTAAEAGVAPLTTASAVKTAAAANDPFSGARDISGASGSVIGSTVGATREDGEPGHGGPGGTASIWYRWTAPENGVLQVTTRGSSFDTLLGGYSGTSLADLRTHAHNDDNGSGGTWSSISFAVDAGTTYYLAVDGYGGWTGSSVINWSLEGPPAPPPAIPNDIFSAAEEITGASGSVIGSTVGAKREAGEPYHGSSTGRASIWYRWTAPADGMLQLSTQGSSFDTLLGAYTGAALADLDRLAANDDFGGGLWSSVTIPVTAGTTYRVAVDGWGGRFGATNLSWNLTEPAPAPEEPTPGDPGSVTRQAASWGLDRIDQAGLPLDGVISTSQNGAGVTAYVIDTGVRPDHADFSGRVTAGFSSISDGNGSNDCNGHGTHVAGTVAGGTYGVAPAATVVPVRVLSCYGSGSTSGVIAGIDYAVRHHQAGTPAVANMSLGGGYSAALNAAVAAGVADGITFVVAAGNSNANACNYSPASEPTAITVGSTASNDWRSSFSNWGSCLDVFAPGSSIRSAWHTSPTATATLSGTSMASPHAAGAAALLLSATPSATPAAVTQAMTGSATNGAVSNPLGSVNRLLRVDSAVPAAPSLTPPQDVTPVTAPRPAPAAAAPRPAPAAAPPRTRARAKSMVLATPGALLARRSSRGITVRIKAPDNLTAMRTKARTVAAARAKAAKRAAAVATRRARSAKSSNEAGTTSASRARTLQRKAAVARRKAARAARAARNPRVTYEVVLNGKRIARTTRTSVTIRTKAARAARKGATVRIRATLPGFRSKLSAPIRLR